jgi:hypothetical protein
MVKIVGRVVKFVKIAILSKPLNVLDVWAVDESGTA